jgi:hypothetical protein
MDTCTCREEKLGYSYWKEFLSKVMYSMKRVGKKIKKKVHKSAYLITTVCSVD